jgi:acid phosphatase family membrane protein YuiD
MDKRFSIHDWQAKQTQKRLDEVQIKKVVDQSMSNADIGALMNIMRNYELGKVLNTIAVIIDRTGGMPSGAAQMVADIVPKVASEKELDEHHAGDYNPGFLKQSVNTFLDKLKEKTKEGKDYKIVEKIMEKHFSAKKQNEASMTGGGASFQAGSGEGYATPYAFKKKKKNN